MKTLVIILAVLSLTPAKSQPTLETGSISSAAERLKPGEYLWAPDVAPEGPILLVVSLATQRAIIYRNGVPIGISTVSTGRPGYQTPTGVFTVLQRHVEHYSRKYGNAPMPYMQRLTWGGIALHGGNLPGYPASHGCIRLPTQFARLLYGVTRLGMSVVITDRVTVPHLAPAEALLSGSATERSATRSDMWRPDLAPDGPVSIVISTSEGRMIVLRNGKIIGRAAITFDGTIDQTSAYVLNGPADKQNWLRINLPGQSAALATNLRGRIHVRDDIRQKVQSILRPGTTVVVTPDTLSPTDRDRRITVIENVAPDQPED